MLGFALGAMFVKEAFNGHSKDKVHCLYTIAEENVGSVFNTNRLMYSYQS